MKRKSLRIRSKFRLLICIPLARLQHFMHKKFLWINPWLLLEIVKNWFTWADNRSRSIMWLLWKYLCKPIPKYSKRIFQDLKWILQRRNSTPKMIISYSNKINLILHCRVIFLKAKKCREIFPSFMDMFKLTFLVISSITLSW